MKATISVDNIHDRSAQSIQVKRLLRRLNCDVLRSAFVSNNRMELFVVANNCKKQEDLKDNIIEQEATLEEGNVPTNEIGSRKIYLRFKG